MQNEAKTCAFCGQVLDGSTRTKEHVWPLWLQKRFGLEKDQFQGNHFGIPWGISTLSTRTQSFSSLVLGGVCASCNNGWMSELETKVAPIFEKLWCPNNDRYTTLELDSCNTLAQWAFKTSLVINLSSNYRKIIPLEHYREFFEFKRLPKNTTVDISLAHFVNNLQWIQGQHAIGKIYTEIDITKDLAKTISSLYVITLDIGGILLKTVWIPTDFLESPLPSSGNVKRIWPYIKPSKLSLQNRKNEITKFSTRTLFRTKKTL